MTLNKLTALATTVILLCSNNLLAQEEPTGEGQVQPQPQSHDQRLEIEPKRLKSMHKKIRHKARQKRKEMAEKRLEELDQNNDDKVDLTEYLSYAEVRFNKLDADGDGYVTKQEARDRHRVLREKHHLQRKQIRQEMQDEAAPNY